MQIELSSKVCPDGEPLTVRVVALPRSQRHTVMRLHLTADRRADIVEDALYDHVIAALRGCGGYYPRRGVITTQAGASVRCLTVANTQSYQRCLLADDRVVAVFATLTGDSLRVVLRAAFDLYRRLLEPAAAFGHVADAWDKADADTRRAIQRAIGTIAAVESVV